MNELLKFCPPGTTHFLVEERTHRGQAVFALLAVVPGGASVPLNGYGTKSLADSTAEKLTAALHTREEDDTMPCGCASGSCYCDGYESDEATGLAGYPDGNGERW